MEPTSPTLPNPQFRLEIADPRGDEASHLIEHRHANGEFSHPRSDVPESPTKQVARSQEDHCGTRGTCSGGTPVFGTNCGHAGSPRRAAGGDQRGPQCRPFVANHRRRTGSQTRRRLSAVPPPTPMPLRLTPALPPRVRRRALPARVTAMVSPTSKSTGLGDGHGFADLAPPVDPANAHPGSPDQVVNLEAAVGDHPVSAYDAWP